MEEIKGFIKKISESGEGTKRKWLILASGIAMVAVIFLWVTFFNPLNQISAPTDQQPEPSQSFAFWQTFKAGLGTIAETAGGALHSLISLIREPKNYIVQPQ